ncbi:hypothetical protein F4802DRAFT_607186 [Xylaria palmicola]|nr:hypothetical protein F4802DRAFT_607186 [Xylaria palmicola]
MGVPPEVDIQLAHSAPDHSIDQPCLMLSHGCVEPTLSQTQSDSKKRKSPPASTCVPDKKVRVDGGAGDHSQPSSNRQLPAEVWQHVFTFLPPRILGRLLSVSRSFNALLVPSSAHSCDDRTIHSHSPLPVLKPELIWQLSRRRFWPTMPTPLRGLTELQMWQLACQGKCEFHNATDRLISSHHEPSTIDTTHSNPRPIWPFALRSCLSCLVEKTTKEVDLLLSPSMLSCLMPALPFVFISDDARVILPATLQTGPTAMNLSMTKVFLSSHIAAIQEELNSVRAMGEATAEEWVKGLEGRGKECRTDSLRWEKFEISGGLGRMRRCLSFDSTQVHAEDHEAMNVSRLLTVAPSETSGVSSELQENYASETILVAPTTSVARSRGSSRAESHTEQKDYSQASPPSSKTLKTKNMKKARRAEIEGWAAQLEPPIPAHVLALLPAFQAAIQVTLPLDDTFWELLKPRLIAQLGHVDQEQQQKREVSCNSRDVSPLNSQDLTVKNKQQFLPNLWGAALWFFSYKHFTNTYWPDAQAPLRTRISALADQIICDGWANGRKLNKATSPQFAADVLLYVRTHFYTEIKESDRAALAAGQRPIPEATNGPYSRKLTLENMKWLFEVKIKPFTESYGKELFYCGACEFATKLYGFEGVIQHFAAKHTRALSLGNMVVHWRAEWPKVPPFHPEPRKIKNPRARPAKYMSASLAGDKIPTSQGQYLHQEQLIQNHDHHMPHIQYDSAPIQPEYAESAPYVPVYVPSHIPPAGEYAYPSHGQLYQRPDDLYLNETTYQGPSGFPHCADMYWPVHATNVDAHQNHDYIPYQNAPAYEAQPSNVNQTSDLSHLKLEDIARNSRDIWFSLFSVKKLPGPIRIFVVIHHVSTRFRTRFLEEPPLGLFIEGLSNSKDMRPIRSVNGLQCRACCLGLGITTPADHDKETYSLPQLVKHFHQRHIEQPHASGGPILNWLTDMLQLPDLRIISDLSSVTNINDQQLTLINNALSMISYGGLQPNPGPVHDAPLRNGHRKVDSRSVSAVHSSQQAPSRRPRTQQIETLRAKRQRHPKTQTTDVAVVEAGQPSRHLMKPKGLGTIRRSSIPLLDHEDNSNAPGRISTMLNIGTSTETRLSQQSLPPTDISQNHVTRYPKTVEGGDDDFDLLAGLESQLDRQAASNCLDNY